MGQPPPVVLYDWAHPQQQQFAQLSRLLKHRADIDARFRDYHAHYHLELALQRRAIKEKLSEALNNNCLPSYEFKSWQRTVRWKFSDHPFCTVGSLSRSGRFNIGTNIDPANYPQFSAFYLGENKKTAEAELLGQDAADAGLDAHELALAKKDSVLTFSVSGKLDRVLDIHDAATLRDLVKLIKDFTLSPALIKAARHLPVAPPKVVTTTIDLQKSLLNPNWRHVPTVCEIPANSQIFGQLVMQAEIEGILYPSKLTGGRCLAIFPCNFVGGTSTMELDDDCPASTVGPEKIDAGNWEACERTSAELKASPLARSA